MQLMELLDLKDYRNSVSLSFIKLYFLKQADFVEAGYYILIST